MIGWWRRKGAASHAFSLQIQVDGAVQSYVLYFFFYSVLGWLYEVFLEVVVYRWGFTNRGVLLGPTAGVRRRRWCSCWPSPA